jgi:hypothetical protein
LTELSADASYLLNTMQKQLMSICLGFEVLTPVAMPSLNHHAAEEYVVPIMTEE